MNFDYYIYLFMCQICFMLPGKSEKFIGIEIWVCYSTVYSTCFMENWLRIELALFLGNWRDDSDFLGNSGLKNDIFEWL